MSMKRDSLSRKPTSKVSPSSSPQLNLRNLMKRHTNFVPFPIDTKKLGTQKNQTIILKKASEGENDEIHSSDSKRSKHIISLENVDIVLPKPNKNESPNPKDPKINGIMKSFSPLRLNSSGNVFKNEPSKLIENDNFLSGIDNKINLLSRKSTQTLNFEVRPPDDDNSKKHNEKVKLKKFFSSNYTRSSMKKSSLAGLYDSYKKNNKDNSEEILEENEKSLQNSGHRSNVKLSIEEIHDLESKRKKSKELFDSSRIQLFHLKVEGIQPKYFHKIKTKSMVIDKSLLGNSQNKSRREQSISQDFTKKNLKMMGIRSPQDKSRSISKNKNKSMKNNEAIENQLKNIIRNKGIHMPRPEISIKNEKNNKKQIMDFYLSLLRKIELLKFSLNYSELNEKKFDPKSLCYSIEIDNVKIDNMDEKQCYASLSSKFGKDYFIMLKKIFSSYGTDKKGLKVLTSRRMCQMARDFNFFHKIPNLDEIKLELFFIKKVPQKNANFRDFIDVLYQLAKMKNKNIQDRVKLFKTFLDEMIIPKYREFSKHLLQYNIDYIQIFYKDYNPYENPTLILLSQQEEFFKHIFSLYQNFDISLCQESFLTIKSFFKFCQDFLILSQLCKHSQLISIFRIFQLGEQEIITYQNFIMVLCCLAHIIFSAHEYNDIYKGFYKKIWKFVEFLLKQNNLISDSLMINNFQTLKT